MLANVIKSQQAIAMSIKIIEVFVKFREMLISQKDMLLKFEQLEKLIVQHDDDIQLIFQSLKQLVQQKNEPREPMGFKLKSWYEIHIPGKVKVSHSAIPFLLIACYDHSLL